MYVHVCVSMCGVCVCVSLSAIKILPWFPTTSAQYTSHVYNVLDVKREKCSDCVYTVWFNCETVKLTDIFLYCACPMENVKFARSPLQSTFQLSSTSRKLSNFSFACILTQKCMTLSSYPSHPYTNQNRSPPYMYSCDCVTHVY